MVTLKKEKKTDLEINIAYRFKDRALFKLALTHRSFSNEKDGNNIDNVQTNNERLEFLGDSVLDLAISELLIEEFPFSSEGILSKKLASLINEKSLATLARRIKLGDAILLGKGEQMTGGNNKDSILADGFEALIAAIYLDGGIKPAIKFIRSQFLPLTTSEHHFVDYKTTLQELSQQKFHCVPLYQLANQSGRDHEKLFEMHVLLQGKSLGVGHGKNKKEAEQAAARNALEQLTQNTQ